MIAVIGLLLQSYVTQTHIHFGAQEAGAFSHTSSHAPAPVQGPLDKAAGCPFCQAIVHAGVFVAASAPPVFPSFLWIGTALLVFARPPASSDTSHGWRSRAPPRG
jgi:hypothetical protein